MREPCLGQHSRQMSGVEKRFDGYNGTKLGTEVGARIQERESYITNVPRDDFARIAKTIRKKRKNNS